MTKRLAKPGFVLLTLLLLLSGIAAANSSGDAAAKSDPIRLAEAKLRVEINATDGDAGLQVFLDGEPWKSMTIFGPDGRKILDIMAKSDLKGYGLTELFSESSEPSFDVFPIEEFMALFPEGKYRFEGLTIEGKEVVGKAKLSHDFPDGPEIVSPADGATVDLNNAVAMWTPVAESPEIDIVAYQVIVEREDPLRVFSIDLSASADSVTIPTEFLESGTEYKLEVVAIEASGNQTLTEITFLVS